MQRFATLLSESFAEPINEPEYMTPQMVYEKFSIQEATVRSWVRSGLVEGFQNRPFLVNTKSLRKYLSEKK
jgi:hypothetical protein